MRKFAPLNKSHPLVGGATCPYCNSVFITGDIVCLQGDAPADQEEAEKKAVGRPYIAKAVPVHASCAGKE